MVDLCRQHSIWLVHDLAYADIVFDGFRAPSILEVPGAKDIAVEFFTLSKSYNMPGWRVGFMVGNKTLVSALARLKSYFDYGTFTPIQVASILALEGPQECVSEICENYRSRRDVPGAGAEQAGMGSGPAESDNVRVGADSRTIQAFRFAGVFDSRCSKRPKSR